MASKAPSTSPSPSYKLAHTPSGSPYIPLTTSAAVPIFLTEYHPTDTAAVHATVSLPSIGQNLISVPQPYTLADAEWWVASQRSGKASLPLQVLRSGDP
jgi:hypothetical protein